MNNKLQVHPSLYIAICVGLFLLPIPWLISWIIAAFLHEIGHIVALKILHVPVHRVTAEVKGAYIETGFLPPRAEFVCALAGPLCGLVCFIMFLKWLPLLAVCGLVQSIFNLLPYPNYDGGRILSIALNTFLPINIARIVYQGITFCVSAALIILGIYFWFELNLGFIALIVCVIPVFKSGTIKIPCKQR